MLSFKKEMLIMVSLLCSLNFSSVQANTPNKLSVEELRIEKVTLALPNVVNQLDSTVTKFINQLSLVDGSKDQIEKNLEILLKSHGQTLWKNASKAFHASQSLDDRPLYWARLKMTKALRQSVGFSQLPSKKQMELMWDFELYSRGKNDIDFEKKTDKKILLLGFDPFLLDLNIEQNNPSGVTALAFDNSLVEYQGTTAEIETLIVPVRYADFDQGIIEELLAPYLKDKSVDMILTVSMGRQHFDLERFPGLRRSAAVPDNLNVNTGANTKNPLIPMLKGKPLDGEEFIEFSLPIAAMMKAEGPYKIFDNREVTIIASSISSLLNKAKGPEVIAVKGSGGGYLSNEISYRSLRLRDLYNPSLPVGHIHTPRVQSFDTKVQQKIIDQINSMIELSIIELK